MRDLEKRVYLTVVSLFISWQQKKDNKMCIVGQQGNSTYSYHLIFYNSRNHIVRDAIKKRFMFKLGTYQWRTCAYDQLMSIKSGDIWGMPYMVARDHDVLTSVGRTRAPWVDLPQQSLPTIAQKNLKESASFYIPQLHMQEFLVFKKQQLASKAVDTLYKLIYRFTYSIPCCQKNSLFFSTTLFFF